MQTHQALFGRTLFFIATHGDVDDTGELAGRLLTPVNSSENELLLKDLANTLKAVPGEIIVFLHSCGSGAAVYDDNSKSSSGARQAAKLNAAVVRAFEQAEPNSGRGQLKTGEFRDTKFHVLTSSAYQQYSWGWEAGPDSADSRNYFTEELRNGILGGAEVNEKNQITLNALYLYLKGRLDNREFIDWDMETGERIVYHQYVQVWPQNCSDPLFQRIPAE